MRLELNGLTEARRRIHFHDESTKRRRDILVEIAKMPVSTVVFVATAKQGVRERDARAARLSELVRMLQHDAVQRLVIESRQDDRSDVAVIERARTREPRLVFEHRRRVDDPMLWIADARRATFRILLGLGTVEQIHAVGCNWMSARSTGRSMYESGVQQRVATPLAIEEPDLRRCPGWIRRVRS